MADTIQTEGETLGERLHRLRRRHGIKIEELADQVGVSASAISRYERDLRDPPTAVTKALARVLRTSPNELLGYSGETHTPGKRDRQKVAA